MVTFVILYLIDLFWFECIKGNLFCILIYSFCQDILSIMPYVFVSMALVSIIPNYISVARPLVSNFYYYLKTIIFKKKF